MSMNCEICNKHLADDGFNRDSNGLPLYWADTKFFDIGDRILLCSVEHSHEWYTQNKDKYTGFKKR